jgi:hypothetical protein
MLVVAIVIVAACITVAIVVCTSIAVAIVVVGPSIAIPVVIRTGIPIAGVVIVAGIAVVIVVIGAGIAIPVVVSTGISIAGVVIVAGIAVVIVVIGASVAIPVVVSTGIPIAGVVIIARVAVAIVVVAASVAIPVVVCTGISIAVIVIVPSISVVIGTSEGVRILSHSVPKFRMILQVGLELGMTLHVVLIVDQLRILAKLLGNFAMAIEELIEVNALFVHALIFVAIITGFLVHESVWIFFQLFANSRMLLHEALERWMAFYEFIVVHERGVLSNLFGNLAVRIKELIELSKFLASDIAIVSRLCILILILSR